MIVIYNNLFKILIGFFYLILFSAAKKYSKSHHERQLSFRLAHRLPCLACLHSSSLRSWTPAPGLPNHHNLKTERKPDQTRSRVALCGADRLVLNTCHTYWLKDAFASLPCFFFVKEKESIKNS